MMPIEQERIEMETNLTCCLFLVEPATELRLRGVPRVYSRPTSSGKDIV